MRGEDSCGSPGRSSEMVDKCQTVVVMSNEASWGSPGRSQREEHKRIKIVSQFNQKIMPQSMHLLSDIICILNMNTFV